MFEQIQQQYPAAYNAIKTATERSGFTMASEVLTCSLLKTLAASKPGGKFLELGTGTGLATTWILDGMDEASTLISIDNDADILNIAKDNLGVDKRLKLICTDGADWIKQNASQTFSFIFADAWPGKYQLLDEVLEMLEQGGIYIIDDMLPQPNWPDGHGAKVTDLLSYLDTREDLAITKLGWASGIVIIAKK
jgi:predicted O-methyltransferase YrrM